MHLPAGGGLPPAAAFYRSLPGALGDRLRSVLKDEDGDTVMTIIDRRCPMWRTDGLCDIQAALGHDALCKTCREFPRLTHDYGNFIEYVPEVHHKDRWNGEIDEFVKCVRTGEKIRSHIDYAILTSEIMQGMYDSAETHREVVFEK